MKLDLNILRANQISIVSLLVLAFVLKVPEVVFLVAIVMLAGSFFPRLALFKRLYSELIRPAFKFEANLKEDDPRPHNFAQGLGGVFLLVSSLGFLLGAPLFAWVVAGLVVALALLNLTTGICVGCFLYFQWKMLAFRVRGA